MVDVAAAALGARFSGAGVAVAENHLMLWRWVVFVFVPGQIVGLTGGFLLGGAD